MAVLTVLLVKIKWMFVVTPLDRRTSIAAVVSSYGGYALTATAPQYFAVAATTDGVSPLPFVVKLGTMQYLSRVRRNISVNSGC